MNAEVNKVTVSKITYAYLKCLQQLDELGNRMHEALELDFGSTTGDKIMQLEYCERSHAMRDLINKYLCISINDNINTESEITEI